MPYRLSAFADEISSDVQIQLDNLLENGIQYCAMRGANGKMLREIAGKGTADVMLNFKTGIYKAHVDVSLYAGIFHVVGDFTFTSSGDVTITATADMVVPAIIPVIGGKSIGGVGIFCSASCRGYGAGRWPSYHGILMCSSTNAVDSESGARPCAA